MLQQTRSVALATEWIMRGRRYTLQVQYTFGVKFED